MPPLRSAHSHVVDKCVRKTLTAKRLAQTDNPGGPDSVFLRLSEATRAKRTDIGDHHNAPSRPNEHHIWFLECFGLMQGQATQRREETEAMCLSGSARVLPPSRSVQSDQGDVLSA